MQQVTFLWLNVRLLLLNICHAEVIYLLINIYGSLYFFARMTAITAKFTESYMYFLKFLNILDITLVNT